MPDKTPLGKPLPLSDADLDAMTTAEETKKAQADGERLWRKANPDLASLLDTTEVAEE